MADWKKLYENWDALSLEMRQKLFLSMEKKAKEKTEDFKKWLLEDPYREKVYFEKFSDNQRFIPKKSPQVLETRLEKSAEETAEKFPTSAPIDVKIRKATLVTVSKAPKVPLSSEGTSVVLPKVTVNEPTSQVPQPIIEKPESALPSPEPEVTNQSRVVFLLKKPITTISSNQETTANKIVFVLDNKETNLPTIESTTETPPEQASKGPISAESESEETKMSPKQSIENVPQVTIPLTAQQKTTGENLISTPRETPKQTPFTETTPPIIRTQPAVETQPKSDTAAPLTPQLIKTAPPSPQAEAVEVVQPPLDTQKPLFRLQLDPQTDISQILSRLNREKDLLVAINNQECWRCKSTEKTLVNYSVGLDKAEIKLTCKKCGATTTLNHEGI